MPVLFIVVGPGFAVLCKPAVSRKMVVFEARNLESVDGLCQDLVENSACEHGAAITENSERSTITN